MVYECPHAGCPRFYEHERNLYAHVRAKHENQKRAEHVCPVPECGRVLATKQKLDQHRKLHLRASNTAGRRKTKSISLEGSSKDMPTGEPGCSATVDEQPAASEQPCALPANVPALSEQKNQLDVTTDSEVESTQTMQNLLETHVQLLCTQLDTLRSNLAQI